MSVDEVNMPGGGEKTTAPTCPFVHDTLNKIARNPPPASAVTTSVGVVKQSGTCAGAV